MRIIHSIRKACPDSLAGRKILVCTHATSTTAVFFLGSVLPPSSSRCFHLHGRLIRNQQIRIMRKLACIESIKMSAVEGAVWLEFLVVFN